MNVGDRVVLHTPDNLRLHGAVATVEAVTAWGAHVRTAAAATGTYRAAFSEMTPAAGAFANGDGRFGHARQDSAALGYTGDICPSCGSVSMRRNGNCLLCDLCGSTSGCS